MCCFWAVDAVGRVAAGWRAKGEKGVVGVLVLIVSYRLASAAGIRGVEEGPPNHCLDHAFALGGVRRCPHGVTAMVSGWADGGGAWHPWLPFRPSRLAPALLQQLRLSASLSTPQPPILLSLNRPFSSV